MRVLVLVLVLLVLLVTGGKQSQLLVLSLSLKFDQRATFLNLLISALLVVIVNKPV